METQLPSLVRELRSLKLRGAAPPQIFFYHKLTVLSHQKFLLLLLWRPEVWNQFHWAEINILPELYFLKRLQERIHLLPLPGSSFQLLLASLVYGHLTPISASVFTLPSPLLSEISLCFHLIKHLWVHIRSTWIISLFHDAELNQICKLFFHKVKFTEIILEISTEKF